MIFSENFRTPLIVSHSPHPVSAPAETDAALLDSARTMDKEALVKIFDLYSTSLYNYALRLSGDPLLADHIVGDVFAKLLDQLSAGHGPGSNLRSYLYQMTYHRIVDEARYSRRRAPIEDLERYYDEKSEYLSLENRLTFERIMHAIQTVLTDDQRHVIVLRFLEGMNVKETAAIIGKQVGYVKVIHGRAIQALRKALCS